MAKIQGELLEQIRAAVAPLDTEEVRQAYRSGNYPRAALVADVNTRYRWDLFYAVWGKALPFAAFDAVPGGVKDAHIETALRSIVPAL